MCVGVLLVRVLENELNVAVAYLKQDAVHLRPVREIEDDAYQMLHVFHLLL